MPRRPGRAVALVGFVLTLLLAGFGLALATSHRQARHDLQERFSERAGLAASMTSSLMATTTASASQVGPAVQRRRISQRSLAKLTADNGGGITLVTDGAGRLIAADPPALALLGKREPSTREAVTTALSTGKPGFTAIVKPSFAREPVIAIAIPYAAPGGRRVLVTGFAAKFTGPFLTAYLEQAVGDGGVGYLVAGRQVIGSTSLDAAGPGNGLADPGLSAALAGGREGEYDGAGGRSWFAAAPVGNTPWSVVIAAPLEAVYAPIDGAWLQWLLFGMAALAAAVSLVLLRRLTVNAADLERANRDLEERNTTIEAANRMKSEFLANMSHELRTPLNSIIGFAELMHDGRVGPIAEDHKEYLGDILTSSRHLLQLINDVLDLSRVESGRLEFEAAAVDLDKLVREVSDVLRSLAAKKGTRITFDVSPEIGPLQLDPAKLKQVLYNLVSNAIKFTDDDGHVTVRARPAGEDGFAIEVEDDGIGIAADDIPRLFREFSQLESSPGRRYGGTGLGLVLVKRIVEAQGGSVSAVSTLGEGSTFRVFLPCVPQTAAPGVEPRAAVPAGSGGPAVLVVEDEPRDQRLIINGLVDAGYDVVLAATGGEAIALLGERRFDAVALDLLLPDMSGWDVLRALRADGANADVPVIAVTVVTPNSVPADLTVAGYLSKPLRAPDLVSALKIGGVDPERRALAAGAPR